MQRTRRYPDDPAGPFPRPPAVFTDDEERRLRIEPLDDSEALDGFGALDDSEAVVDALTTMYSQFHPADRAQGIPPASEPQIRSWLAPLVENGINVAVRPVSTDEPKNGTASGSAPDRVDDEPGYVGHAVLVPETDEPDSIADPGEVEWELAIFVLQAYQGAGIGTELLAHLLGEASARGVDRVWLTVERWNGAAITVYERTGFRTVGTESFDIEMAIRLSGE
ncbi:GNAT family N-acetyltransferase [Halovivax gelatinilyticus]|uniref:GNAT family N-acetyltransferase n=1 Tax=Halovivax gelatinilyticus TaxID=2961597 RepID=UPI0020CA6305|nr:GNAT family N-acetyltransferase [Halovivax gelatinilyticus]